MVSGDLEEREGQTKRYRRRWRKEREQKEKERREKEEKRKQKDRKRLSVVGQVRELES